MHTIDIHKKALKFLEELEDDIKEKILARIKGLGENPYYKDVVRIKGREGIFRTRIGRHRILYHVDSGARIVYILKIDKRETAYD